MSKVIFDMSMSLDGFVAGPNDGPDNGLGDGGDALFAWYGNGDTDYMMPSGDMTFKMSAASARALDKSIQSIGALLTARRTFDIAHAWNGRHPLDVPVVVMTHRIPHEWVREGSPFTFVTDGIESAVAKAKTLAGDRDVTVGSASTLQQALKAGLLDEIHIDLTPVMLGGGVRLFDHLGIAPVQLEQIGVVEGNGVTHLHYRVVRANKNT